MTPSPKFPVCPYGTNRGRCYHKLREDRKSKVKGQCGYLHPKNCDIYCEWLELSNVSKLKEKTIFTHSKPLNRLNLKRSKK